MNKFFKKAFSLAEILIALAIVSVIATMGFSIAKKGIANAYKEYFFTGYNGLNTALQIAKKEIYDDNANEEIDEDILRDKFIDHIQYTLNMKKTGTQFSAPNGIIYKIVTNKYNDKGIPYMDIEMKVPATKTDSVKENYRFAYFSYDPDEPFLLPVHKEGSQTTNGYIDLTSRKDLIAFACTISPNKTIYDCPDKFNSFNECTESKEDAKIEILSYKDYKSEYINTCIEIKPINPKYYTKRETS